jgi:3'-phosphoadenosine 5'-phosphosulfate sulfotransferase (PAPS reductase)/FAD synthetase
MPNETTQNPIILTPETAAGTKQSGHTLTDMKEVPRLTISRELHEAEPYDPDRNYSFRYRSKNHRQLPHVVKFSGGRSSGLLLFTLLENGILNQERGDVVVFNNTSCEHPETYRFVAECKARVEAAGAPFFLVQYQTYEDARQGEWRRLPSYRLVNDRPFSEENPDGFQWRGEVFEEMISSKAYLPNQFSRVCTHSLKLETTRQFLRDWFASKKGIPLQGHGLEQSLLDSDTLYRQHLRSGGSVPKEILMAKKRYALGRPTSRPKQAYKDFSAPAAPFENETLRDKVFGQRAWFGEGGIEYVAFIGLRGDEQLRVTRVETRSSNPHANVGYEGEHVYMPLATMNINKEDVNTFWDQQDWDLDLPRDGSLSNCVYCFLKGVNNLAQVHATMESQKTTEIEGFGATTGSPCDINWWASKENEYGRDLEEEHRERTNPDSPNFIGFFGATSGFSYELLAANANNEEVLEHFASTILPCDCTE